MDAISIQSVTNTSIDHENIYTEIESSQSNEATSCDKAKHESLIDKPTQEQEEEDDILCQLGARPRVKPRSSLYEKSSTIDIRNEISQWYDEASREVERDLSLDLDVLDNARKTDTTKIQESDSESDDSACEKTEGGHIYEHVALQIPGTNCQIVNGKLVIQPKKPTVTLLRDFDPLLHEKEKDKNMDFEEKDDTSDDEDVEAYASEPIHCPLPNDVDGAGALITSPVTDSTCHKDDKKKDNKSQQPIRPENIYSDSPFLQRKDYRNILDDEMGEGSDRDSFDSRLDLPPPMSPPPPPPLPDSQPPVVPRRHPAYENVWLGTDTNNEVKIRPAPSPPTLSSAKDGSSSPAPSKPPRPSMYKTTIAEPTHSEEKSNKQRDKFDSFSSEENDMKEDNQRIFRQTSYTSAISQSTQHSNTGILLSTIATYVYKINFINNVMA